MQNIKTSLKRNVTREDHRELTRAVPKKKALITATQEQIDATQEPTIPTDLIDMIVQMIDIDQIIATDIKIEEDHLTEFGVIAIEIVIEDTTTIDEIREKSTTEEEGTILLDY